MCLRDLLQLRWHATEKKEDRLGECKALRHFNNWQAFFMGVGLFSCADGNNWLIARALMGQAELLGSSDSSRRGTERSSCVS